MAEASRGGHNFFGNQVGENGRAHFGDNYVVYNLALDAHVRHSIALGSEERIGVTASMAGLWNLTGALHAQMKAILSIPDYTHNKLIQDTSAAVAACRITLETFRRRLGLLEDQSRAELIKADKLITFFTNAVLLFDELRVLLQARNLHTEDEYRSLRSLLDRVRDQNWAWGLQVFILSSRDEETVSRTVPTLDRLTAKLLSNNPNLRNRMYDFQQQLQDLGDDQLNFAETGVNDTTSVFAPAQIVDHTLNRLSMTPAEFEQALNESWVYKRAQNRIASMSFRDSISFGWSELSGFSLADISIISVIALPVRRSELAHGDFYSSTSEAIPEEEGDVVSDENPKHDVPSQAQVAQPQRQIRPVLRHPAKLPRIPDVSRFSGLWSDELAEQDASDTSPSGTPRSTTPRPDTPRWIKPRPDTPPPSSPLLPDLLLEHASTSDPVIPTQDSSIPNPKTLSEILKDPKSDHTVLFIAASLFDFNIAEDRREANFPYLLYTPGEIFSIVAKHGELWLAYNQEDDDDDRKLGWIWEQHFAILKEDRGGEDWI